MPQWKENPSLSAEAMLIGFICGLSSAFCIVAGVGGGDWQALFVGIFLLSVSSLEMVLLWYAGLLRSRMERAKPFMCHWCRERFTDRDGLNAHYGSMMSGSLAWKTRN